MVERYGTRRRVRVAAAIAARRYYLTAHLDIAGRASNYARPGVDLGVCGPAEGIILSPIPPPRPSTPSACSMEQVLASFPLASMSLRALRGRFRSHGQHAPSFSPLRRRRVIIEGEFLSEERLALPVLMPRRCPAASRAPRSTRERKGSMVE